MQVLLIEDEVETARGVELMLRSEHHDVLTADSVKDAIELGKRYVYDIILLDLNLSNAPGTDVSDLSGYEVLRSLRAAGVKTPILILSGHQSTEHKVQGFGFGADDYMTKPFHKDELIARISAIVRRSKGGNQTVYATDFIAAFLERLKRPATTAEIRAALRDSGILIKDSSLNWTLTNLNTRGLACTRFG